MLELMVAVYMLEDFSHAPSCNALFDLYCSILFALVNIASIFYVLYSYVNINTHISQYIHCDVFIYYLMFATMV
jgi:hypothetical protein